MQLNKIISLLDFESFNKKKTMIFLFDDSNDIY
jgi:hypothetical protein